MFEDIAVADGLIDAGFAVGLTAIGFALGELLGAGTGLVIATLILATAPEADDD